MDVVELPLERLIPYARNPRKNAAAVATVAASLYRVFSNIRRVANLRANCPDFVYRRCGILPD
jgi:hypothetical protein